MTPAERLQAAIDKLERLKAESGYVEFNGWLAEPNPGDTVRSHLEPRDDLSPITNDPLLVTLHRTIDGQIGLLQYTLGMLIHDDVRAGQLDQVLALADAILGGAE
ncbi:MAG TPA: hypothetical protein VNR37_03345 [Microbacteriaceae bacterium]|nr:hypothetical protein [Microbacteriaceae bacterium]